MVTNGSISPLSWVPNRWPNSVGVNAVQKPDVFEAVSERSEVVTKAINGKTQITTIKPRTTCLNVLVIVSAPSLFVHAVFALH